MTLIEETTISEATYLSGTVPIAVEHRKCADVTDNAISANFQKQSTFDYFEFESSVPRG